MAIAVGDFAHVPAGALFLEAPEEFVVHAAAIKRLSETDAARAP